MITWFLTEINLREQTPFPAVVFAACEKQKAEKASVKLKTKVRESNWFLEPNDVCDQLSRKVNSQARWLNYDECLLFSVPEIVKRELERHVKVRSLESYAYCTKEKNALSPLLVSCSITKVIFCLGFLVFNESYWKKNGLFPRRWLIGLSVRILSKRRFTVEDEVSYFSITIFAPS